MTLKEFVQTYLQVDSTTVLLRNLTTPIMGPLNSFLNHNPDDQSADMTTLRVYKFDTAIITYDMPTKAAMFEYFQTNPPAHFSDERIDGLYQLACAVYLRQIGQFDNTLPYFENAIRAFSNTNEWNELYRTYANMLRQYSALAPDLDKSYELAAKMKDIFPKVSSTYYAMFGCNVLSSFYTIVGDNEQAQSYFAQSEGYAYPALAEITEYNKPVPFENLNNLPDARILTFRDVAQFEPPRIEQVERATVPLSGEASDDEDNVQMNDRRPSPGL